MKRILSWILLSSIILALSGCGGKIDEQDENPPEQNKPVAAASVYEHTPEPTPYPYTKYQAAADAAVSGLKNMLQEEKDTLWIYKDFSSAENRFTQKCLIADISSYVMEMDENWQDAPCMGSSCIRCEQKTAPLHWGGWLFLNGYLPEGSSEVRLNSGANDGEGLDLNGADCLRFWAKGESGGEIVEFFTAGFGYDGETGAQTALYPDSCRKQTLGYVTLSNEWEEYCIDLCGKDLSYIVCGFGYVLSGDYSGQGNTVFYLDEIRFEGTGVNKAHMLLKSYDTSNQYLVNTAYSYDNALAAMAFLSAGEYQNAAEILNAFVYAVNHDRFLSGRVRNAYSCGGISSDPGWGESVRLPGWFDKEQAMWCEDRYQVGCNTGNTSYVALALLQGSRFINNADYLSAARSLMDWVIDFCGGEEPGFIAGYDGWMESGASASYLLTYKSLEHNIDAYAAFKELFELTGEGKYAEAAESALTFIESMYDKERGIFYTGTTDNGVTPSKDNLVLDAQVWCAMALGKSFAPYESALALVDSMRTEENAYPFCAANANGGWWSEGTAFTALLLRELGRDIEATASLDTLCEVQLENGMFPAASVDNLSTGIYLFDGTPWYYGTNAHIAPAAWFVMAVNNFNPYDFT